MMKMSLTFFFTLFVSASFAHAASIADIKKITCGAARAPLENVCFGKVEEKFYLTLSFNSGEKAVYEATNLVDIWQGGEGYDGFDTVTHIIKYSKVDEALKLVDEVGMNLGITHLKSFPDVEGRAFGEYLPGQKFQVLLLDVGDIVRSNMLELIPKA